MTVLFENERTIQHDYQVRFIGSTSYTYFYKSGNDQSKTIWDCSITCQWRKVTLHNCIVWTGLPMDFSKFLPKETLTKQYSFNQQKIRSKICGFKNPVVIFYNSFKVTKNPLVIHYTIIPWYITVYCSFTDLSLSDWWAHMFLWGSQNFKWIHVPGTTPFNYIWMSLSF